MEFSQRIYDFCKAAMGHTKQYPMADDYMDIIAHQREPFCPISMGPSRFIFNRHARLVIDHVERRMLQENFVDWPLLKYHLEILQLEHELRNV